MRIKPVVLFFLLALSCFSVFSSPLDSIGVTKINNKLHVRYMVSPGETIYGISTKFGVPISDLMEINPELENGLKVGQVINIPYNPEAMKPEKKYDDNVIVHKVQPGETFYSLSKKYNTSVDELMKMNNIQLKAGQEIVVGYKSQASNSSSSNVPVANNTNQTNTTTTTAKQETVSKVEKPKEENKTNNVSTATNNNTSAKTTTNVNNSSSANTLVKNAEQAAEAEQASSVYPFDPSRQQVLVIPFDPYLYFSDADDEIAARSDMPRTKVRQVFRKRLNAMLDAPGYETIHLLGGKAKDSLSDLNKIYGMVTYNYQQAVQSPYYKESEAANPVEVKNNKNWLERQKNKLLNNGESSSKYDIPQDYGSYFGVIIKNPEFFTYFNNKYSVDYYIFVSQFEVKTNYEHCLDRAAQNYDRTFTTHFSIFDSTGKQIAGNKFKTHYNSNSNYVYQIVADNVEKIAKRILADLPPPGGDEPKTK